MRLLVVEDDPNLSRLITRGLREESYAVDQCENGDQAISQAAINSYDAIVLDVMLPGADGFEVVRTLRSRSIRTPVLMLTARDAVVDRITGLDSGADDYLVKPFDFGELLARLRALLRRPDALQPMRVEIADLIIDMQAHTAHRAGVAISLTAKEYALLELFARNIDRVLAHGNRRPRLGRQSRPIHQCGRSLRESVALQDRPRSWAPLIHTRRGLGYLLSATPPA